MAFNLERNKGKVDEIKQNIEAKKSELAKLEENKEKLMDAGSDIQGSEIDEEVQETIMEQINRALEENAEKGTELSGEMDSDARQLDELKQETSESISSNDEQKSKLEQKKALLDRFGLGGSLEDAISELDDNKQDLEEFNEELIETEKEMHEVSHKLSSL
ncbi:MAG: hypothetical protein IJB76_04880 [Clostridia bacterium]|nr:hypothetical protein [Clostridia bacterium]